MADVEVTTLGEVFATKARVEVVEVGIVRLVFATYRDGVSRETVSVVMPASCLAALIQSGQPNHSGTRRRQ